MREPKPALIERLYALITTEGVFYIRAKSVGNAEKRANTGMGVPSTKIIRIEEA